MSDRRLNAEQQRLFEDHSFLAEREARYFRHRQRRFYLPEEVRQVALEGLWLASWYYRPAPDAMPFGAFASQQIRWQLNGHYFGRFGEGIAAFRHAREHEVSGSTPIELGYDDSEVVTVMSLADRNLPSRKLGPGLDRLHSRLADLREAIRRPGLLSPRERQLLALKLGDLKLDTIAARLRVSKPVVVRTFRSAVRKLRVHFASRGLETLPVEAPMPFLGDPGERAA